jgi:hypothetical protein
VPNPYLIIGAILLWIASLVSVGHWQNTAGHESERVTWQAKEVKELTDANANILRLETDARKAEADHATALSDISTNYQGKLTYAETQRKTDVAAARSGTLRLFDPGASGQSACASGASQAAASTGGRDGSQTSGLSPAAAEFLLSEADRADVIIEQLTSCQAVVQSDRALH